MEEQDYILFEAYLANDLSEDDLAAFNKRLKTDVQFKEMFEIYKDLSTHLKQEIGNKQEHLNFKANVERISKQYFKVDNKVDTGGQTFQKSYFYKYAIAASIIILIGVFVFKPFSSPTYEDYNNFDPISLMVRSSEDVATRNAEQSFNSQNYKEAIVAFNAILQKDNSNSEVQLYKSIALVEANQFEEADRLLKRLSQGNSVYKNNAKWILALSYLKQQNTVSCVDVLKTIPDEAKDFKQAQKLLNQLD